LEFACIDVLQLITAVLSRARSCLLIRFVDTLFFFFKQKTAYEIGQ